MTKRYRMGNELVDEADMPRWHHERGIPWGPKFNGPDPITVRRMVRPTNLSVHMTNEHGYSKCYPHCETDIHHAIAHMYGRFRAGQEHYHTDPRRGT